MVFAGVSVTSFGNSGCKVPETIRGDRRVENRVEEQDADQNAPCEGRRKPDFLHSGTFMALFIAFMREQKLWFAAPLW